MEIVFYGMLFAVGMYLAPFALVFIVMLVAFIFNFLGSDFKRR